MKITKLDYLANIEINTQNCDEIIAESLELMKQASTIKLKKMETEERSRRIKRGLANRREQQRLLGANR